MTFVNLSVWFDLTDVTERERLPRRQISQEPEINKHLTASASQRRSVTVEVPAVSSARQPGAGPVL